MNEERKLSEEMLNAFVDGELDAAEWANVAARLERDAALRERVGELRALKDMVRHAYAAASSRRAPAPRAAGSRWMALAAAGAAFVVLGWAGHAWWEAANAPAPVHALREGGHSSPGGGSRATEPSRVLVHVTSGRLDALAAALDEVEDLLRSAGRSVEVEIVANHAGLELFRAGPAPLAQRVEALRSAYPNLSLVACGESLERQRAGGRPVELLPGTAIASSALERVIERQKGGWVYVRS